MSRPLLRTLLAASLLTACSALVGGDIGGGVGATCSANADCQGEGAICDSAGKTCTLSCASASCPTGSMCDGTKMCRKAAPVGIIYDGDADSPGFAHAHKVGMRAVMDAKNVPIAALIERSVITTVGAGNTELAAAVLASIESVIAAGATDVIMTTNRFDITEAAKKFPNVHFYQYDSPRSLSPSLPNFASYYGNRHQAWFIAGSQIGAYTKSLPTASNCVSLYMPLPLPDETISFANAFALGVKEATANTRVNLVWFNSFYPSDDSMGKAVAEETCPVVISRLGAGTALYKAGTSTNPAIKYVVGNDDPDACELTFANSPTGLEKCVGSIYWNFEYIYGPMLGEALSGKFAPKMYTYNLAASPAVSPYGFATNGKAPPAMKSADGQFSAQFRALVKDGEDNTFATVDLAAATQWWNTAAAASGAFAAPSAAGIPTSAKAAQRGSNLREVHNMCWFTGVSSQVMAPSGTGTERLPPFGTGPSGECDRLFQ